MSIPMRKALPAAAMLLTMLVASTSAQDSAAIHDGRGEIDVFRGTITSPQVDILHARVFAQGGHTAFEFEVADLSHVTVPGEGLIFSLTFRTQELSWGAVMAHLMRECLPADPWCEPFAFYAISRETLEGESAVDFVDGGFDLERSTVTILVPRVMLDATLTHTKASSLLALPTGGGGFMGGGTYWWIKDRAPDDGYGPDMEP